MNFTKLVPNLFYRDIQIGLRTFIYCLEFSFGHEELSSASEVTLRPWGASEFAMLDGQIGIRVQQW
jgi:hypothetical protein